MKAVSILYLLTVASAMSIQPRQFGGRFRGGFGGGGNGVNGVGAVDDNNDNNNGNVNVPQNGNGGNGNGNGNDDDNANGDATGDANGDVPQNNDDNNNSNAGNGNNNAGADGGATDDTTNGDGAADDTTNGGGAADDATNGGGAADDTTGNDGAAGDNTNGGGNQAADGQTVVFTEIGGIPGNECLTLRNNGEIVDAACVNEAADRQLTPDGNSLRVQRTFTAGFRPDLVDVQACVGFNGTHFRAEDCNAQGIELVTFNNGELRASGGACASGHDDLAQMTVDATGNNCATYTTTNVQPAAV
ncbi:hypothetical protein CEP54_014788 [Fusarium duplospermum]|uniref:Uncharacterized protein n=1 Tax=Fusarium duplospermum TaxID=1325734 RepID=A0A428NTQ7_9HYPO|nr:hypothetical protein CEP54_014788 [Fusarium duplospermum]